MTRTVPHVLLVTPGFPADENDFLCIPPAQLMLRALTVRKPDVRLSVLALHYPAEKRHYRWHGIGVQAIGGANRRWPFRLVHLLQAWQAAALFDRDHPFTHVHSLWLTDAAATAWWIARGRHCPLSLTAMGQDVLQRNPYLARLARSSAALVAISDRAGKILRESTGHDPDTVIPWGIDPPPRPLPSWHDREINILGVGSMIELKRWSLLLETVGELATVNTPHRTVLVGDGPLRHELEAEAHRRGLADAVTFTGTLPRPDVLRLMERAQVLVHPARFEGQGFVFCEALSRGMSIVSGPVGMAQASPRWKVVEPPAFAASCRALFSDSPPTSAEIPHSLGDTVEAYRRLWRL